MPQQSTAYGNKLQNTDLFSRFSSGSCSIFTTSAQSPFMPFCTTLRFNFLFETKVAAIQCRWMALNFR